MIEDAVEEEHAVVKVGWSGSGALAIPATQYATQLVGGDPADQFPHLGWTQVFQWPTTATATITNRSTRATTTTADVSKMMITGNTELADRDADETQDLFGAHHTIELEQQLLWVVDMHQLRQKGAAEVIPALLGLLEVGSAVSSVLGDDVGTSDDGFAEGSQEGAQEGFQVVGSRKSSSLGWTER